MLVQADAEVVTNTETGEVTPAPVEGAENIDGAVVADNTENITPDNSGESQDNDELILGKFKNQDALIKSYQALEKMISTKQAPASNDGGENTDGTSNDDTKDRSNEAFLTDAKMQDLQEEFNTHGGLLETSYKELEDAGYPKSFIDSFISGQQAIAQNQIGEVHKLAGGEDQFNNMSKWASENLDADTLDWYNATVDTNANIAVQFLKDRFQASNHTSVNRPSVQSSVNQSAITPFANQGEIQSAFNDPRYAKDPGYRAKVEARMAVSG